jgi:ribA/ribD-fused uncharacterized protein
MILIEDKVTDTHVYFWGDPTLSNWGPAEFDYMGEHFYNSEQAYMWEKAMFFDDFETAEKILATDNPSVAKDLGREVRNYNDEQWSVVRFGYMVDVCFEKFKQNPHRLETLLSTEDRIIVEASPHDRVWGVGLHWTDEKILDEKNWKGENLLGKALMRVRDGLK